LSSMKFPKNSLERPLALMEPPKNSLARPLTLMELPKNFLARPLALMELPKNSLEAPLRSAEFPTSSLDGRRIDRASRPADDALRHGSESAPRSAATQRPPMRPSARARMPRRRRGRSAEPADRTESSGIARCVAAGLRCVRVGAGRSVPPRRHRRSNSAYSSVP
jgi:hypothetical protein